MPTEYPACSQTDDVLGDRYIEALGGKTVSRNESEPESASLHQLEVVNLPKVMKPDTEPEEIFKFYSLYGHLCGSKLLEAAWRQVKANGGGAGVDGIRLKDIKKHWESEKVFLENIHKELASKRYRPEKVRRVYIPKANETGLIYL